MIEHEVAPAKINLALHIRNRRDDGYHELETLFVFAADGDELFVSPSAEISLCIDGPMGAGLSHGEDNLVLRAARLLADAADVRTGAALRLLKNLPVASGIGGGSADAAAALRLLNRFWSINWPQDRLAQLAAPLGADVPACVHSRMMIGSGKGDELVPVDLPELSAVPILLVNPRIELSTGPVFRAWDGKDRGALDIDRSFASVLKARNDLQPGAIELCPIIADVLDSLSSLAGVTMVRMSGSGATCFALFDSLPACRAGHDALVREHPDWWVLETTLNQPLKPRSLQER